MNKKAFLAAAAMLALTACAGQELGNARNAGMDNGDFGNALSAGYLRLAQAEYAESDYADSDYFALRSMQAGTKGGSVDLPAIESRTFPKGDAIYVATARNELEEVFNAGAREKAPQLAAAAQVSYECWIQELEENQNPAHIAACQDQLDGLIPALRNAVAGAPKKVAGAPKKKAKPTKGKTFQVLFGTGSPKLDAAANKMIVDAAAHAKKFKQVRVVVSGYTDSAGSASGNLALSERRAALVAAALRIRGVPRTSIKTNGFGEDFPAVRTGAGVSEPKNRRVDIAVGGK
jgi:OmpA-OmpF porin, OOP family